MLTPLAVAALGLLGERPMHPYEMFQLLIARSEDSLVKVRPGTLYHTIDRLRQSGLVAAVGTERAGNRPERTTYELLPAGQRALEDWVRATVAEPVHEYPRFPVAVAELHTLPLDEAAALLERRLDILRVDLALLRDASTRMEEDGLPERFRLDLELSAALVEAEADWVERLAARLRDGGVEWPAGAPGTSGAAPPGASGAATTSS